MRFDLDTDVMLAKCERLQWSVDELDWGAPGADAVDDDLRARLAGFMGDLHWLESLAALAFRAMAETTREPALRGIFASFALDEQRHSDAELLLMRRWGLVGARARPPVNVNARNLLGALERSAHRIHPSVFSAIIPFTELVLDGALVKHLDELVRDPISREVFRRINADEARHLAVDFYMLERHGRERSRAGTALQGLAALAHPAVVYGLLLGYLPLLPRMGANVERLGIPEEKLLACVRRYIDLGDESPGVKRHAIYTFFRLISRRIDGGRAGALDFLMRLSDLCDALHLRLEPGDPDARRQPVARA